MDDNENLATPTSSSEQFNFQKDKMQHNNPIVVYGAAGHTGRFVAAELKRRGFSPVLAGRDPAKLDQVGAAFPDLEKRLARTTDPAALDRAFSDAEIVINCAGPFIDTAPAIIEAALRGRAHYLDIAAEQAAVHHAFETFDIAARSAGVVVAPANGFYGGLGDILATVAMGDWSVADEISIVAALDSWRPTKGTRLTGERNPGQRYHFTNGKLERRDSFPSRSWEFPAPFGRQSVASLALSEAILIPHHLQTREVRFYLNTRPLADLQDPDTPEPTPADDSGRSESDLHRRGGSSPQRGGAARQRQRARYICDYRAYRGRGCGTTDRRETANRRCTRYRRAVRRTSVPARSFTRTVARS